MIEPPIPANEAARIDVLDRFRLRGITAEPAFDTLTGVTAELMSVPIALVSIIDTDLQCFAGATGIHVPHTPRSLAFCAFTILDDMTMIVPDAREDPRFHDNPMVTGAPYIRFYAGAPLRIAGSRVGSLCIIDTKPRELALEAIRNLEALARIGKTLIESRLAVLLNAENERRLDSFLNAMPVALAIYGEDDQLIRANSRYHNTFFPGDKSDPPVNACFADLLDSIEAGGLRMLVNGEDTDWKRHRLQKVRNTLGSYEVQLSTGRWLACEEVRTPHGELVATFTDVTDLKDREAAEKAQSALLRETLESIDEGIALFDDRGILIACSDAYYDMLELPSHLRRLGTPMSNLVSDLVARGYLGKEDSDQVEADLRTSIARGESLRGEFRTPDGRTLAFTRRVTDDRRTIITCLDVTARKEVERLKDEFVSTVSHELRTPLTSITGSLGLLSGGVAGELSPRASRLVGIAYKNVQRLTRLVNDLLDIDKIEGGQIEFRRDRIEVNPLVEQSVEQNRPYADRLGVYLAVEPASQSPMVLGDLDRLLQVLANLISNAVKYSPPGGTVTIAVGSQGDSVRIEVIDHGPGIPEQFTSRIFSRFAQADASDRRGQEGTGLGLSIARAIVERHDGTIGFKTEQGVGTTFWFQLPLVRHADTSRCVGEAPRFLICDENRSSGMVLTRLIERSGAEADLVGTREEALRRLDDHRYQGMLLDLMLPDEDGVELIRNVRARADQADLPIIVVSASGDEARKSMEASGLNVLDWLEKPVDLARLATAVSRCSATDMSGRPCVLHVEDEVPLGSVVTMALAGFADVEVAPNLATARQMLEARLYDAIILDLGLPDGSGVELLPEVIRSADRQIPVIIFSGEEISREVAARVHRALVKSRTSVDQLAAAVRKLVIHAATHPT